MLKGKGAQYNPRNPYLKNEIAQLHDEGIDEYTHQEKPPVQVFYENPKSVISKNDSPDLKWSYSVNPYQGCEHGCVYCYARNSHTYWGFSAGLDFESKIIVKENVAEKVENQIQKKSWQVQPIMLSGNTDCYQPLEKKLGLTRKILQVLLRYRHPVSIITKNALVLRDIDLLEELAAEGLVHVYLSITSLDEKLRSVLEPRTSSARKKMEAIHLLSNRSIPVGIMNAPIIPGLNQHEIPEILKLAADKGALGAGYTVVRLNGQIGEIFFDWLQKTFPNKSQKIKNQIESVHGGKINDTKWGRRLHGDGSYADIISQLFEKSYEKYFKDRKMPPFNLSRFRKAGQYPLF